MCIEALAEAGVELHPSDYPDLSSDNEGEKPSRRKPKVSWAT